jgi:ribosomal protein S12 methylthiotransferase accessory factor
VSAFALGHVAPTPLAEGLRRLRTLVSPYVGIVRAVGEFAAAPDDARLFRVGCRVADVAPLLGVDVDFRAGASAPSRRAAVAATLGEVAERYSASSSQPDDGVLATWSELGSAAVEPERFALFGDEQYSSGGFPFRRFTRETPVRWLEGFSIPSGRRALLPRQLVRLAWRPEPGSGEIPVGYSTSSGAACGCTLEEAVLRGLLELIERDAFLVVWANRLSLPLLDWSRHQQLTELDRRYFRPSGLAYAAVDLSVFFQVPTVLGVVRDERTAGAALGVGAAAAARVDEAWVRALAEAFSVRTWARLTSGGDETAPAAIETFDDHIRFYSSRDRARITRFLDSSGERRDVRDVQPLEGDEVAGQIAALAARLEARGVSAYGVDVTAADVRAAGLRVAKVVSPELCALDVAHDARFLGARRLYRAAFELGLRTSPLAPEELNPYPHPFP